MSIPPQIRQLWGLGMFSVARQRLLICRYGPDVLSLEPFSATFAGRKELNFIVCLLGTGQIWLELQTLIPRST